MRDVAQLLPEIERSPDWCAFLREVEVDRDPARVLAAEPPLERSFRGSRCGAAEDSLSGVAP